MPLITKIANPGTTTVTQFAGDTLNLLSDWTNNIDVAASDSSLKPIINTDTLFQPGRIKIYDTDNTNTFAISTQANLAANKTINLPSISASSDDIVLAGAVQTLTGKTLDGASNTITGVTVSSKSGLPSSVVFNDQNNAIGPYYIEIQEATTPGNPTSGRRRLWVDSTTHKLSARTSAGTTVSLEEGLTGTWDPNAAETLTNKTMSGSSNTFTNIQDSSLSANISKLNANQTVTGIKTIQNYQDIQAVTEPAAPSSTYARLYVRATDANNDELVIWLKKRGSYEKVVIA